MVIVCVQESLRVVVFDVVLLLFCNSGIQNPEREYSLYYPPQEYFRTLEIRARLGILCSHP